MLKQVAMKEIVKSKYKEFIPQLINILENSKEDMKLRAEAAKSLGVFKNDKTVAAALMNGLSVDNDLPLRMSCAASLGDIGGNDAAVLNKLLKILSDVDSESELVMEVIDALEKIGDKRVQYLLVDVVIVHEELYVKKRALRAIGKIGDKVVVKELQEAAELLKKEKDFQDDIVPDIKKVIEILSKK
ncbi:MAG: HEAT repeat domain-containing protein [Candidatus Firestonebacteria bacterium]